MERVDALSSDLERYLGYFEDLDLFTGPSVHFHKRTLEVLDQYRSPAHAARDERFAEYLYATLTAWGLHRMGNTATKLLSFTKFAGSLREAAPAVRELQDYRLLDLAPDQVGRVTEKVWQALERLRLSASKTKIITNSKALHHLLPALVPPIDREYTLRFFYGHGNLTRGEERTFAEIFPLFHCIGIRCSGAIKRSVGRGFNTSETKVIDNASRGRCNRSKGFNTSETKVIDNAIVGFVTKKLKS